MSHLRYHPYICPYCDVARSVKSFPIKKHVMAKHPGKEVRSLHCVNEEIEKKIANSYFKLKLSNLADESFVESHENNVKEDVEEEEEEEDMEEADMDDEDPDPPQSPVETAPQNHFKCKFCSYETSFKTDITWWRRSTTSPSSAPTAPMPRPRGRLSPSTTRWSIRAARWRSKRRSMGRRKSWWGRCSKRRTSRKNPKKQPRGCRRVPGRSSTTLDSLQVGSLPSRRPLLSPKWHLSRNSSTPFLWNRTRRCSSAPNALTPTAAWSWSGATWSNTAPTDSSALTAIIMPTTPARSGSTPKPSTRAWPSNSPRSPISPACPPTSRPKALHMPAPFTRVRAGFSWCEKLHVLSINIFSKVFMTCNRSLTEVRKCECVFSYWIIMKR